MPEILIINGPNLNLTGRREPAIYGTRSMDDILADVARHFEGRARITTFQSNHEGEIIDRLHAAGFGAVDGIVLNAGAYTHTSLAIADAIAAIRIPVIEVHISNIAAREAIRHTSLIAPVCQGSIAGFGLNSYFLAAQAIIMTD